MYKCNCSTCVKMGILHLRPINPASDFVLLSPTDPVTELGDYRCFAKKTDWYFCKNCGVRCFALGGSGETVEIDLDKWLQRVEMDTQGQENKTKVFKPKAGEWKIISEAGKEEVRPSVYLSINAVTLEPDQEGLSLKEWTEKGWIAYVDARNRTGQPRLGEPHEGGVY